MMSEGCDHRSRDSLIIGSSDSLFTGIRDSLITRSRYSLLLELQTRNRKVSSSQLVG